MIVRSLFRLLAAVLLASMMPATPHAALPTGLQYDELVRVVVGATAPPAGNFTADLAAANSPAPAESLAPRRRVGLGALAGAVLSGNIAGAAADAVVGSALDAQTDRLLAASAGAFASALRGLTQGRVERHSFYGGWERVDDVADATATIRKCDLHQVIVLNLARKTYTIYDPSAEPPDTRPAVPPPGHRRHTESATPAPAAPGTASADFTDSVTALGAQRFDGLDATGYDQTSTFAMSQATGSCKSGTFSFHTRAYYSKLAQPRVSCPITPGRQRYPQTPVNFVASGGCRPTFTAHKTGPVPPSQNLALYTAITVSGAAAGVASPAPVPSGTALGYVFLTERGNVHSLSAQDATLFEIPKDFAPAP